MYLGGGVLEIGKPQSGVRLIFLSTTPFSGCPEKRTPRNSISGSLRLAPFSKGVASKWQFVLWFPFFTNPEKDSVIWDTVDTKRAIQSQGRHQIRSPIRTFWTSIPCSHLSSKWNPQSGTFAQLEQTKLSIFDPQPLAI